MGYNKLSLKLNEIILYQGCKIETFAKEFKKYFFNSVYEEYKK